jgi:dihydroorotate dehydrogenase (NAD+) catalytic subunit
MNKPILSHQFCGVQFKNPIVAASGTFGFGLEHKPYMDIEKLGGISIKGLTLEPREGNKPPRIAETSSGMLNSVGLQNPGVDYFIDSLLPYLKDLDTVMIVNINGNTIDEYQAMADRLAKQPIDMIELNVSCPNVKHGGAAFGVSAEMVYRVTKAVKENCGQPVIVKLSPNVTSIVDIATAAQEGGGNAVSLINTVLGMAINARQRKPVLGNVLGGLSGPAVKPIALRMVHQINQALNIPIMGMGGIVTGEDVAEFLLVGAMIVQVGTANLCSPDACVGIIDELEQFMIENKIEDVNNLIGGLIL